jgi:hypothetical protein
MKSFEKQLISEIRRQELQKVSRAKELVKLLERLVKQDHLYTEDKIKEMRSQLSVVKQEIAQLEAKTSKGFGKK